VRPPAPGRRRPGLPDVLANGRPDERLSAADEQRVAAGLEVPILVEDPVVGKKHLAVHAPHLPVDANGAAVEEIAIEVGSPDERRDPLRLRSDRRERVGRGAQKARTEQEVLRRVAGHRQLGEEDEVGSGVARLLEARNDPLAVAVEVAHDGVHLSQG
jgi:hypothetical protein